MRGHKHTAASKQKMADAKRGKKRPESVKQQISETKTGQTYDETHRANISAGLKGKPKTAESNAKRAEAARAYWAAKRAAAAGINPSSAI
ncbi:adenine specific DNA methylase Mod [Ensifer sp. KUDG1]|uniref:NUMOD3 domain-containing DNA-binding protein n=1 Tax=Ensifer sp. KUDG1 TaxID=3373919 RepID=UPI003D238780